jgi:hypothetical protein
MKVKLESIVSLLSLNLNILRFMHIYCTKKISVGTHQWLFNLGLHISVSFRTGSLSLSHTEQWYSTLD